MNTESLLQGFIKYIYIFLFSQQKKKESYQKEKLMKKVPLLSIRSERTDLAVVKDDAWIKSEWAKEEVLGEIYLYSSDMQVHDTSY